MQVRKEELASQDSNAKETTFPPRVMQVSSAQTTPRPLCSTTNAERDISVQEDNLIPTKTSANLVATVLVNHPRCTSVQQVPTCFLWELHQSLIVRSARRVPIVQVKEQPSSQPTIAMPDTIVNLKKRMLSLNFVRKDQNAQQEPELRSNVCQVLINPLLDKTSAWIALRAISVMESTERTNRSATRDSTV